MSEPDEALKYARGQGYRAMALEIADTYRAGQAASAERIKALKEALEPFSEAATHLHPSHSDDARTLDGIEVRHWRRAWVVFNAKEADR